MPKKSDSPIVVFADGACTGNPGPGGWGVVIATPDGHVTELGGFERETTNNKMEMTAVGRALRHLETTEGPVDIFTDSTYVIHGITKWVWGWRKNGWKTAEGKDVANAEFWKRLMALLAKRDKEKSPVAFKYTRGHVGIPGNERVDEIAVAFAKGKRIALYDGPLLKYDVAIHDIPEDTSPPEMRKRDDQPKKVAHSYLSLVGGSPVRHREWKDCERRVKGVPGAKFKKCMSAADETALLESWGLKEKDLKED